jgi:hypothetical protein
MNGAHGDAGAGAPPPQKLVELVGAGEPAPKELVELVELRAREARGEVRGLNKPFEEEVVMSNKKRKRLNKAEESYMKAELVKWRRNDEQSTIQNYIDRMNKKSLEQVLTSESLVAREADLVKELLNATTEMKRAMERADAADSKGNHRQLPDPLFRTGQTVLQFWANWFASEQLDSGRTKASGGARPKWYVGEILAGPTEHTCITYGGVRVEAYCYYVH